MTLSEDDKKRIEEEEYRKHVRSQLQDSRRVEVDLKNDQRVETHGVGREMYRDAKAAAKIAAEEIRRATTVRLANVLKIIAIILLFFAAIFVLDWFASLLR